MVKVKRGLGAMLREEAAAPSDDPMTVSNLSRPQTVGTVAESGTLDTELQTFEVTDSAIAATPPSDRAEVSPATENDIHDATHGVGVIKPVSDKSTNSVSLFDTLNQTAASSPQDTTPLFQRLSRKETRLREEQYEALTQLARQLNRRKAKGIPERITENTLIRVAIDLMLDHRETLQGNTENELLKSLVRVLKQ